MTDSRKRMKHTVCWFCWMHQQEPQTLTVHLCSGQSHTLLLLVKSQFDDHSCGLEPEPVTCCMDNQRLETVSEVFVAKAWKHTYQNTRQAEQADQLLHLSHLVEWIFGHDESRQHLMQKLADWLLSGQNIPQMTTEKQQNKLCK